MPTGLTNSTANQHYVSQTEQRLNAINPNAKSENQRIYSFSLVDRESFTLSLDSPNGRLISQSLSLRDVFSFDILPDRTRRNFEDLFGGYEATIRTSTLSLLNKLDGGGSPDIKDEILAIFVAKFMNFLRNPFSIKKVLNTIGPLLHYEPTDPDILAQFKMVVEGSKPQEAHLCGELGITPDEYRGWLGALFFMLIRLMPDQPNFMEQTVKGLYEMPSGFPMACVHRYAIGDPDKVCLLSDRGFASPLPEPYTSFNFNLSSKAFISYVFAPIEKIAPPISVPHQVLEKLFEAYRKGRKTVRVTHSLNDFAALASYNQSVVSWCFKNVYSSSPSVYGVTTKMDTAGVTSERQTRREWIPPEDGR
ncbi:MAG TPA: hypothetical protein VJ983_02150 [candidate division Zixibacteria bacterium]|nr:hypothetical protein [candidate division Zixibacteria bacterium]